MENLLAFAVLFPFATALILLLVPSRRPGIVRGISLCAVTAVLAAVLGLFRHFDRGDGGFQFIWEVPWIASLGIVLRFGVDGISMVLLLLTGIVSLTGILVSAEIHKREKEYYILFLSLTTGIAGTFTSLDLFFFYFFYEMAVIPMYLLIGVWGSLPPGRHGRTKEYATMKLTLYLTAGAVLAAIGLMTVYVAGGRSFDFLLLADHLRQHPLDPPLQTFIFGLLLFGFGFLASLWPFHTWSPIGYAAAPTAASMMHAGVLKKLGAYGILRLGITLCPEGARVWAPLLAGLAAVNILYAGLTALLQRDWKFVIGYSSVSHMGYILLGIATLNLTGVSGAVLLMFAHGVMAALTFSLIGFFYHQTHNRFVTDLSGLAKQTPFIAVCMLMAVMASSGLPGFANFASEVLVFLGAWQQGTLLFRAVTLCAVWGIVITAAYLLWALRRSFFGAFDGRWSMLKDAAGFRQKFPYVFLIAVLLTVGFCPRIFTDIITQSVSRMIQTPAPVPDDATRVELSKAAP